jgi:hypothetical protein
MEDTMPPREDKVTKPHKNMGVYLPADIITALTRMADAKKMTRNNLIVTTLTKLAKKYVKDES